MTIGLKNISRAESAAHVPEVLDVHVVLLTAFVAPHKLPIYEALARRVRKLTVLVSTAMESNRLWQPEFGNVDVQVQKTLTFSRPRRHPHGFEYPLYVHIPWDTLSHLRRLRPDVIISHEFGFRSVFSSVYKMLSRQTPLIFWAGLSEHTEKGKGWHRYLLRKVLLKFANNVVVNGDSGGRYLQKMGLPPKRIFRFPYATIPSKFDDYTPQRDPDVSQRLLYVGMINECKGILPFLQGLALWGEQHPERDIVFDLVGDGPLRKEVAAFPVPHNVHLKLWGHLDYSELADRYENAGIFVFPTMKDDWGMVTNEAMNAALPVLGSVYSQAVDQMIVHGKNGWRFRTDHPDEVTSAIDDALSTPHAALLEMGQAAKQRIAHRTPDYAAQHLVTAILAAREDGF